jgi:4Fe-4S ferredoxin
MAACPVNALEVFSSNPVTDAKIYSVINGKSINLDLKSELCGGCGVCIEACPYCVILLSGRGVFPTGNVF